MRISLAFCPLSVVAFALILGGNGCGKSVSVLSTDGAASTGGGAGGASGAATGGTSGAPAGGVSGAGSGGMTGSPDAREKDAPPAAGGMTGSGGTTAGADVAVSAGGSRGTGGAIPDPGFVACGSSSCNTSTDFCCTMPSNPGAETCMAKATAMATCYTSGGNVVGCDEPSDCPTAGQSCLIGSNAPLTIECTAISSQTGGVIVCKSDADCTGTPCVTQTCFTGTAGYQTISTCGSDPWAGCSPHPG